MGEAVRVEEFHIDPAVEPACLHNTQLADRKAAPLSSAQQQIWLHGALAPEIPLYNETVTIHRKGTLDVQVLERSLTEIVRRHQAWRTTFPPADGEPVQVIQPVAPVRVQVIDLKELPPSQKELEARRLAVEDSVRPFDLSRGPLFRYLLVHFSDAEHRLFLTLHHIIFDRDSVHRAFLPELRTLYSAFSARQEPTLPELPFQYPDFAQWERDWIACDQHLSSQLAYWRKQLGGGIPAIQLPTDRPRPAIPSFRGAIQPIAFGKKLGEKLEQLSRQEGVTLFTTLLAGFAVLLQRYSRLEDVAVGTIGSGRKRSEAEGLLGCFSNPLVLRNDLSGNPTFRELLRRTQNVVQQALSNDGPPFTHVVNEVLPSRNLGFNPLFEVLFTLESPLPETQDGWSVSLASSEVDTGVSRFDLCLELDHLPSGVVGRFRYATDLFDPVTIARLTGHLSTLLESVVANPEQLISTLPLLTAPERQQLLDWNDTRTDYPADLLLHELFMRQAERMPEATAVVVGDNQLTYGELDRKSDRLAAYLQRRGIRAEMPVGLYLEPSLEIIVGIMAVLKAAGACVPLDPSYPVERLAHAVADTQMGFLLTQNHLRSELPPHNAAVLCLDSDWSQVEQEGGEYVRGQCAPEKLAYVIYTSGSTGKPKGVQIEHRNLVHSTHARAIYYGPDAERFLLLSSFAFNSSVAGIFGTLSQGGTLVLTPGSLKSNLTQLAYLLEHHRVSHTLCVPTLYSLILEQAKPHQLDCLRVAILGGESCPPELVEHHYKLLPGATLFNEYGPTEAAVWSTVYKCQPGRPGKLVPIGRPIPNARVYVLDPHLNLLPVGVPGELYIGGPGVARGYLNRPAETAKSFIRDPFSELLDARLYKTGDMVRYLADGNLEILGRFDHQVKIRGFRIELEEIESVIREYPGVRQAVVSVNERAGGDPRLVGHVVPSGSSQLDTENLRRFLSRKLPEAMVPSVYVTLEKLPLMPNGKVNRHALPAVPEPVSKTQPVPPKNVLESELAEIWQTVFSKQEIGVTDNFFDLGGNSLLVAKVLLGIEQRFGKRLSLASIFQAPTIQQLAETLEEKSQQLSHPGVVPVQPKGSRPPLFWVDCGPMFLHAANLLGPNQPVLGLRVPASEAPRFRVPGRIEEGAAELVRYLREVQPAGPYYLAGLCIAGIVAYEMARQLVSDGQQVALLALFDIPGPADHDSPQKDGMQASPKKTKTEILLAELWRGGISGLPGFAYRRSMAIARRLKLLRWRIQQAVGLEINRNRLLNDPDAIEEPASYFSTPRPYPGRVMFFRSDDWEGPNEAWGRLVSGGWEVHRVSGGHCSMFSEEHVNSVVRSLKDCLARSQSKTA